MPTIYSVYNVILSYCFQTCDVNLNQIEKISLNSPYIVITGKPGNENAQYFVCGEKMVLIESKSFLDCVIDLFCCFFVLIWFTQKASLDFFCLFRSLCLGSLTTRCHRHALQTSPKIFQLFDQYHILRLTYFNMLLYCNTSTYHMLLLSYSF